MHAWPALPEPQVQSGKPDMLAGMGANLPKDHVRRQILEARRALSAEAVARWSQAIARRLDSLPAFHEAGTVLSYIDSKDNEAATRPALLRLFNRDVTVGVPVAEPGGRLTWSRFSAWDDLAPGAYGILEPAGGARSPVEITGDTVVLVPGIAFDRRGFRIGYGKGYFDRFLAGFTGVSIALAYHMQLVEAVPEEPHDIPVDYIVTELETIACYGNP